MREYLQEKASIAGIPLTFQRPPYKLKQDLRDPEDCDGSNSTKRFLSLEIQLPFAVPAPKVAQDVDVTMRKPSLVEQACCLYAIVERHTSVTPQKGRLVEAAAE